MGILIRVVGWYVPDIASTASDDKQPAVSLLQVQSDFGEDLARESQDTYITDPKSLDGHVFQVGPTLKSVQIAFRPVGPFPFDPGQFGMLSNPAGFVL